MHRTSDKSNAKILHVDGVDNVGAEALSRLPTKVPTAEEKEGFLSMKAHTFDKVLPLGMTRMMKSNQQKDK